MEAILGYPERPYLKNRINPQRENKQTSKQKMEGKKVEQAWWHMPAILALSKCMPEILALNKCMPAILALRKRMLAILALRKPMPAILALSKGIPVILNSANFLNFCNSENTGRNIRSLQQAWAKIQSQQELGLQFKG